MRDSSYFVLIYSHAPAYSFYNDMRFIFWLLSEFVKRLTCCHSSASQAGGQATWLQACSSGGLLSMHSTLDTDSVRLPATDLAQDTLRVCSPTPHDTEHGFHMLTSHLKKSHQHTNHFKWMGHTGYSWKIGKIGILQHNEVRMECKFGVHWGGPALFTYNSLKIAILQVVDDWYLSIISVIDNR